MTGTATTARRGCRDGGAPRSSRSRAATIGALLAALVLAACGGSGDASRLVADTSPGTTGTSPSEGGSGATGGGGTTTAPPPSAPADDGFAWVPFGPANPGDPPPQQWYGNLQQADCEGLDNAVGSEPGRNLWRALAAVCGAAIGGDESRWVLAREAAAQAGPDDEGWDSCLGRAARALLERALAWHARHPDAVPQVSLPAFGRRTACPMRITAVALSGPDGPTPDAPLSGPLAGGTSIDLEVQGGGERPSVSFGGRQGHRVTYGGGHVVVETPPAEAPGPVQIRLRNEAGEVVADVEFTYVADGG